MRRKQRRRKLLISLLVLLSCSILLFLFFFKSNFFVVKTISITGDELECATQSQIKDQSGFLGRNFFTLDLIKSLKEIKNKYICIKKVNASRSFSGKVNIDISSRKPIAKVIKLQNGEASASALFENLATPSAQESQDLYLMDDEGILYSQKLDNLNLMNIFTYDSNISLGKKIKGEYSENSLKIIEKVRSFGISINSTVLVDKYLMLYADPRIIFRLDSDIETQIASLQLILEKAKIDTSMVEFVDLRFDKPIIKIAPKKNG